MFEDIATQLVYEIESDFLLALLIELPTEIYSKSVLELAIQYHRTSFCNDARISTLLSHMWFETEYLNPKKKVRSIDIPFYKIFSLLYRSPVGFYFAPLGLYITTSASYIFYVFYMTYITYLQIYPYYSVPFVEILFWIMNAGYIAYEISEMMHKGSKYFSADSILNVFDVIISLNWIILASIRFFPQFWFGLEYCATTTSDDTAHEDYGTVNGCTRDSHNSTLVLIYMAIWSIQSVILWVRVIGLFQRTEALGPFLRVLVQIFKDILSFFFLAVVVFIGFIFALYFIIAGDLDNTYSEAADDDDQLSTYLASVKGCAFYLIQTFLGQQDWEVITANESYHFGSNRSRLTEGLVLIFVVFGTLLLLNLLIAVMSNTFNTQQSRAQKELAFSRLETTFDLANRGRLMPPPLNLFAILLWLIFEVVYYIAAICKYPNYTTFVNNLNPYFVGCLTRARGKIIVKERNETVLNETASKKDDINEMLPSNFVSSHGSIRATNVRGIDFGNDIISSPKNMDFNALRVASIRARKASVESGKNEASLEPKWYEKLQCIQTIFTFFSKIEFQGAHCKEQYCKYCYCSMDTIKGGDIENYFVLLENSGFVLDMEDRLRLKRLFRYCELCPLCFRPFGIIIGPVIFGQTMIHVDRYTRHKVLSEIASFYVFVLLIWVPLLMVFSVAALISYYVSKSGALEGTSHMHGNNKASDSGRELGDPFDNYHKGYWHESINQAIDSVKRNN